MKAPILLPILVSALLLAGCQTSTTTTTTTSAPAPAAAPMPAPAPASAPTPAPAPAATTAPAMATVNVAGDWSWTCCDGHYSGELTLEQDADNKLTGRLYDQNDTTGGAVQGTVSGNKVQFARDWGDSFHQDYTLTLSDDGKKLQGDLDGTRDEAVGSDFQATRK